jgi:hypothetical protein
VNQRFIFSPIIRVKLALLVLPLEKLLKLYMGGIIRNLLM